MANTLERRLQREIAARLHAEQIANEKISELHETIAGFGKSTATTQNRENLRKIIDQCTKQPGWILALVSVNCEGNVDIDTKLQKKIEKNVRQSFADYSSGHSFMALRSTEYLVAFLARTKKEAREILDGVRKSTLSTTLCEQQNKVYFSCSAAITYESYRKNLASLINPLNDGIKKAHQLGGNRIIEVDAFKPEPLNNCIPFSPKLYHLISSGQIWFHFQPIIDIANNNVFAHEALIRNDIEIDQKSLVNKFTGLLRSNEKKEMRQISFDLLLSGFNKTRIKNGSTLTINVDLFEIYDNDLYHIICSFQNELKKHDINVTLEILEGEKFCEGSMNVVRRRLQDLRARGANVALDDFGVEQSNLSRLLELDVDYIKLDRSLTQSLNQNAKANSIVQSTSQLCADLGIEIIA